MKNCEFLLVEKLDNNKVIIQCINCPNKNTIFSSIGVNLKQACKSEPIRHIYLGDRLSKLFYKLGFKYFCMGCNKRRRWLNRIDYKFRQKFKKLWRKLS